MTHEALCVQWDVQSQIFAYKIIVFQLSDKNKTFEFSASIATYCQNLSAIFLILFVHLSEQLMIFWSNVSDRFGSTFAYPSRHMSRPTPL